MMSSEIDFEQDEMKEIIDDFLVEADELIISLDSNFVKLESSPDDPDLLNEIFRAAHTIKGTSSFLGFDQVTTLSHKMEDILNKLRKAEMAVTAEIMDLLLEGLDLLKILLENVRDGNTEELNLDDILERLIAAFENDGVSSSSDSKSKTESPPKEKKSEEELDKELERLLAERNVPVSPANTDSKSTLEKVDTASPTAPPKKSVADQTIRVDVERLDSLMNMMGELVLGRNSLAQSLNTLNSEQEGEHHLEHVINASNSISFITTELQMAVMKMRMLPIGKVFNRYPRLVRDLSRESKKQIKLEISGESTELDKSVIEEIGDPLVHIIRNSCDHGIESPEERIQKGKPAEGTIQLKASQEGSNIVLKIIDDGRGLNLDAIKAKALENKLVSQSDLESMSRKEIFNFVFGAGFSTAKKVTNVSGRGVGMDVVRTNIEKLNGIIELDSEIDVGTTLIIKLPLTLAIIQGILVEVKDEVFVLPLSSVHETVKMAGNKIFFVNQKPVMRLREDVIPIINVSHLLRDSQRCFEMEEKPYIVVVGFAEKKLGISIDRFLGQEEVVIKSLGNYLGSTQGIAGATILGDGRIRLIVDIPGLFGVAKKLKL